MSILGVKLERKRPILDFHPERIVFKYQRKVLRKFRTFTVLQLQLNKTLVNQQRMVAATLLHRSGRKTNGSPQKKQGVTLPIRRLRTRCRRFCETAVHGRSA